MNETLHDQGPAPHPGPAPQPQATPPHQDLDRLRRSTSNRYIAGVAGGLGRHFNIDPTILRVLLVVLTFFGGAGLVIYAVCWLFVPEDDADHAVVHIGTEPRKILLLAAAGIAFLLAVGDAFNGFGAGWPIVSIAVIVAIVLIARDRRNNGSPGPAPAAPPAPGTTPPASGDASAWAASSTGTPGFSSPAATAPVGGSAYGAEDTRVLDPTAAPAWQPPAWQPQVGRPPLVAPRPKRTGIIWFWPTLALIAVGLGALGIYDHGHHVADGAYPALALGITAVMLLVGSVVGRPGGLILIGFFSSVALAGSVVVGGSFGVDARDIHETPATAADVQSHYKNTVGDIRIDLTQVSDPADLAGRTIHADLRTGYIEVIVPRSLNVDIDAKMSGAGGVSIPGDDSGGFNHAARRHLTAVPASTSAPLQLDLDARFGQITVEYR
ncbi:PspC domain-containing protein [Nocardioides pocheonensis]|nr:PspC domain-containing protein [Nocardioides pocheonensis]